MSLLKFTIPYIWYASNYDYIVTNLCENRNDPDHECNGYCQLQKKVRSQHDHHDSEDQQKAPLKTSHENRIDLFHDYLLYTNDDFSTEVSSLSFFDCKDLASSWNSDVITPPPQFV